MPAVAVDGSVAIGWVAVEAATRQPVEVLSRIGGRIS